MAVPNTYLAVAPCIDIVYCVSTASRRTPPRVRCNSSHKLLVISIFFSSLAPFLLLLPAYKRVLRLLSSFFILSWGWLLAFFLAEMVLDGFSLMWSNFVTYVYEWSVDLERFLRYMYLATDSLQLSCFVCCPASWPTQKILQHAFWTFVLGNGGLGDAWSGVTECW